MKKFLLTPLAFLALAQIGHSQCAPVFTSCPTDSSTMPDAGLCTANITYTTPAFTGCSSGILVQTAGLPSGSNFTIGTTTNTFEVNGLIFEEDFSDNLAGWALGAEWQIAPATASSCFGVGSEDPGTDVSPSGDNGVAGMVIGGCITTALHGYEYLTSPVFNAAGVTTLTLDFWRFLNSDYTPYMNNIIEVYDGVAWQLIWQSGPSPNIIDASWTPITHDISAYANANMQIRFGLNVGSGGAYTVSGWNIDDIAITAATGVTCSFDIVVDPITNAISDAICTGDSYTLGTQTLTTGGTYVEVFTTGAGCDSTVTLTLAENPLLTASDAASFCTGNSYIFGTQTLTTGGTYNEVFSSVLTGCDSTVTLVLTEVTAPIAAATNNVDGTLSATGTGTYQWLNCGTNAQVTGATSATFVPTVNGSYAVIVTGTGCSDTSACVAYNSVGLTENGLISLTVYPNPTNGMLTINFGQELNDAYVVITNVLGEQVYAENVSGSTKHELNLEQSTGIYFVNVYTEGNLVSTVRVVKQ